MSKIRILPTETANRIAAGEVVERPASVVKELVENAIDAEAGKIVVKTENGGRKLIQVTDDGCGMDYDDAMLALEAHATSKIQDFFDIDRIQTLGFRGEALPSIAGVSRFRLQTRPPEATAGTEIVVDSGTVRDVRECGCPPGTTVTVRNLFSNLPARRKFLRTAATEQGHIQEMILLQALAHPKVGFELTFDNQPVLRVPPGSDLPTRLQMLLGRETGKAMIRVDYQEDDVSVRGYAGRPGMTRSSRREQRFFVNSRPAAADPVFFAVRDAYHTLVMKGRYPPVVLYLEVAPEEVDVNVHPTKREIRFRDGRRIGRIVAAAIRRALRELTGDMVPSAPSPPATSAHRQSSTPAETEDISQTPPTRPDGPREHTDSNRENTAADTGEQAKSNTPAVGAESRIEPVPLPFENALGAKCEAGTSPSAASHSLLPDLSIIGTMQNLYLLAESEDGLILIDHHAAHERVLYEKLLHQIESESSPSQPLLLPVNLEFSPADAALLRNNLDAFSKLGFQVEPFGGSSFLVSGVPGHLPRENIEGMMRDLLEELQTAGSTGAGRLDEQRIAQAACKHAAKAADSLAEAEIGRLLEDLAKTEMPYTCPHGRPVMINIPQTEIEKRFGRRQ